MAITFPALPSEGEDNWYSKRDTFDTKVKNVLQQHEDDLSDKVDSSALAAVATSGKYTDLDDVPDDFFSGDYDDLINKPTLFSGSYDDLDDKPSIPQGYLVLGKSDPVPGGTPSDTLIIRPKV